MEVPLGGLYVARQRTGDAPSGGRLHPPVRSGLRWWPVRRRLLEWPDPSAVRSGTAGSSRVGIQTDPARRGRSSATRWEMARRSQPNDATSLARLMGAGTVGNLVSQVTGVSRAQAGTMVASGEAFRPRQNPAASHPSPSTNERTRTPTSTPCPGRHPPFCRKDRPTKRRVRLVDRPRRAVPRAVPTGSVGADDRGDRCPRPAIVSFSITFNGPSGETGKEVG